MKDASLLERIEEPRERSWLFFSFGVLAPASFYALLWLIGHFGSAHIHGMLALAALILSGVLSISFFVAAAFASYAAMTSLPEPRVWSRQLETFFISAPALVVAIGFLYVGIKQLVAA